MQNNLKLLGHTIRGHQIFPLPERIRKIQEWTTPRNKKELQSFLGVVNYLAPHLPHASTIIAPLTELTGNLSWRWDDLQQTAFDQVKRLCDAQVPITPTDYKRVKEGTVRVFLVTDASKVGCGAIICHGADLESARTNIAALNSRRFTATHKNYNTTEQ